MPIRQKEKIPGEELFADRVYTEVELQDFHNKIQRFYEEKETSEGEKFRRFNYDKFAIAFGALREHPGPMGKPYLLSTPDRYRQMVNLMNQYDRWRSLREAKAEYARKRELEELDKII